MAVVLRTLNMKPVVALCLCIAVLDFTLFAQHSASARASSGLRATALLEVDAQGHARLVPLILKVGDRFFDADLYRANPRPLSLDAAIVYEAMRTGESAGLFTVTGAQQVQGVWVGLGDWRPKLPGEEAEPAKKPKAAKPRNDFGDDSPPILTRAKPAENKDNDKDKPAENKDDKKDDKAAPSSASQPAAPADTVSSGSKPATKATPTTSPTSSSSAASAEDSDHPVLRRGKPKEDSGDFVLPAFAEKPGAVHPPAAGAVAGPASASAASQHIEVLTAVSDAAGPTSRSYAISLKPEELAKYEKSLRQSAYDAMRKFAAIRPQHKPAPITALTDVQIREFDVYTSNEPELVFSAALPESLPVGASSPFRYFATIVVQVDMYGDFHPLLTRATDSDHLDEDPRLELIDVVDADGSGSGQFLFREVTASAYKYALYRIAMDKLWLLFETAERSL
jgi:hypothetical protein